MRHYSLGILAVLAFSLVGAQAQDVEPCDVFPGVTNSYGSLLSTLLNGNSDLDNDGMPDNLSLALVEAVACIDTMSDMNDATYNAFNMNRAVFDLEIIEGDLLPYRDAIAMLMLISADAQGNLNAALDSVLTGTYEIVQCTGTDCTPDPVPEVDASVAVRSLAVITRATNEPYSGTGDLDQDGTNNVTEYNNVIAKGGRSHDFVVAATSANLDGTETIRNPGGSSSGGCFVATAAYGTPLANEIFVLREVRDTYLMNSVLGRAFVDTYYRMSPPLADAVAQNPLLRRPAQIMIALVIEAIQSPLWKGLLSIFSIALMAFGSRYMRIRRIV